MDENNFHGINNLDADLIAMGWSSLAVGFPSGTIKVFGRMNLCSEKVCFQLFLLSHLSILSVLCLIGSVSWQRPEVPQVRRGCFDQCLIFLD